MTKTEFMLGACFAVTMFAAPGVHAQETPAADETAEQDRDTIVVTAQRRSQSIQDVPIAIQAFSSDALADNGIRSPQELGQFTPNVTINSPTGIGGQPNVTIRGIGLADFNSNNAGPNGVYIDEFYLSAPSAQGVGFFDLERVEVLKGPQGTLYGRNTSGGAINLITAKPTQELSASAHAEYSSFDTVRLEGAVGGGITETISVRLAGTYNNSRGYMYNHLRSRWENGFNNFSVRGQLLFEPTPDFRILLKAQWFDSKNRPAMYKFYGLVDPDLNICSRADVYANNCAEPLSGYTGRKGFYEGDWNVDEKATLRDFLTTARIEYDLSPSVTLVSLSGYDNNRRYHPEDSDASPLNMIQVTYGVRSKEFTQEVRLVGSSSRFNWVLGGYYLYERLNQNQPNLGGIDVDSIWGPGSCDGLCQFQDNRNRQATDSYAVFGQAEFNATDRLTLIAGGRYSHDKRSFDSFSQTFYQLGGSGNYGPPIVSQINTDLSQGKFNWRLGANYKINPDVMLFANVATGFKSGGFNGGFLDPDPAIRAVQLLPFKPETVTAYEVGIKSELFDRRVTFNLSAFYNDYRNQQVFVTIPNPSVGGPPIGVLDNAKKNRTYGIDADLNVEITPELSVSGTLGLLDTKLVEFVPSRDPAQPDYSGNRLPLASKTSATLAANYEREVGPGALKLQWNSTYRSKYYFNTANNELTAQPGFWLHNARIGYELDGGRWEIAGFMRNITKSKYLLNNGDLVLIPVYAQLTGIVGTPRWTGVEVNFRY